MKALVANPAILVLLARRAPEASRSGGRDVTRLRPMREGAWASWACAEDRRQAAPCGELRTARSSY
jgi:hypothetical protein